MKVAVCIPVHGDLRQGFVMSLAALLISSAKAGLEVEVIMQSGSVLPTLRTNLALLALGKGADSLFWLDADQTFPDTALLRLVKHRQPMVAANYPRKTEPFLPTSIGLDGKHCLTTPEKASGAMEEVATVGFGCCLISRSVFDALEAKAKLNGRVSFHPLFAFTSLKTGQTEGEDYFFCQRAREAGVKIFVDHALSAAFGHIGDRVYTFRDTVEQHGRAMIAQAKAMAKAEG